MLRRSVSERLGYDPFSNLASRELTVRIRRVTRGHEGVLGITEEGGVVRDEKTVVSEGECTDLVEAMALTISVALDPMSILKPESSSLSPPPRELEPELPVAPTATPARDDTTARVHSPEPFRRGPPLVFSIGAGPAFTQGDAPAPVVGGIVYGAFRRGALGGVLEGHATLAGTASTERGRVSSWSATGLGGVCGHLSIFFGCAMAGLGVINASSDVSGNREDHALVALAGPRAGVLWPIGSRLELRAQADALLALTRHRLGIDHVDVYELAPGRLGAAALVGARF